MLQNHMKIQHSLFRGIRSESDQTRNEFSKQKYPAFSHVFCLMICIHYMQPTLVTLTGRRRRPSAGRRTAGRGAGQGGASLAGAWPQRRAHGCGQDGGRLAAAGEAAVGRRAGKRRRPRAGRRPAGGRGQGGGRLLAAGRAAGGQKATNARPPCKILKGLDGVCSPWLSPGSRASPFFRILIKSIRADPKR